MKRSKQKIAISGLAATMVVAFAVKAQANTGSYILSDPDLIFASLRIEGAYDQAKAQNLERWLVSEISAFCLADYGDKKVKGKADKVCQNLAQASALFGPQQTQTITASGLKAKDASNIIRLLGGAHKILKTESTGGTASELAFEKARRALYSAYAEMPERTETLIPGTAPKKTILDGIMKNIHKFYLSNLSADPVDVELPKSLSAAVENEKEARGAINEKGQDLRKTPGVSVVDAAFKFDVPSNHFMWMNRAQKLEAGKNAAERWASLEKRIESIVRDDEKIPTYDLKSASRLLVYEKTKNSATSPKIEVKDLHGLEWKLKWGDEVHSETIANRLYIAAGGKWSDLVYVKGPDFANANGAGTILLIDAEESDEEKSCVGQKVVDAASLVNCLKTSRYDANIESHILLHGKLNDPKFANVRSQVEKVAQEQGGKVKGTESFVIFRESLVEFQGKKTMVRGGPIGLRGHGTLDDRALRGQILYQLWIANRDLKEDNARSLLVPGKNGELEYIETIHDQGFSMGSTKAAAEFGNLTDTFIEVKDGFLKGPRLAFNEALLYRPEIYLHSTYSDMLWMAKHILEISEDDLKWVLDQTNWPDFMKTAAIGKLLARQLNIAQMFGMKADQQRLSALVAQYKQDYVVEMTVTKGADGFAKANFRGKKGSEVVEKVFGDNVPLAQLVGSEKTAAQYIGKTVTEQVLVRGELLPCEPGKSVVQDLMIRAVNTSGYFYRLGRVIDHSPTEEIRGCGIHAPTAADVSRYLGPKK
jgi:hypothetical protein